MIMAIAECSYTEALDFLVEMSNSEQKSKILYVALGDAITRLLIAKTGSADTAIEKAIQTGNSMLLDGAMRATAMLNLIPTDKNIEKIITYGNTLDINDCHRAWIAAASAGWHGTQVDCFLDDSIKSTNQQTKRAATAALKKQYLKWSPL